MDEIDNFFGDVNEEAEDDIFNNDNEQDSNKDDKLNDLLERGVVKPKRKIHSFVLNENLMIGPRGIAALKETFKDFKPDVKEKPYTNLRSLMKKYNQWGHLMYPSAKFEDVISRCETLGTRRAVKVYMTKMRLGMPLTDEDFRKSSTKKTTKEIPIIDDGADDDEDEKKETSEEKQNNSSNEKNAKRDDYNDAYDEYLQEEDRNRQQEQMEDELLADFDMNQDW